MRWIKCSDRLPENDEYVLVFNKGPCAIYINAYSTCNCRWLLERCRDVTHWMPLPEFPQGFKKDAN